ncbi:MAG: 5'-flap endonuclease [Watsoniomyces obsoletus]|nr:MAG: 5'-flap endonuclease [Watsoniomyces obsoletus]
MAAPMEPRNDTYTPVSAEGSEWSGISRYQSALSNHSPSPSSPPNVHQRGPSVATPPVSGGSYNDGSAGNIGRRAGGNSGNPSPPSSIARSSDGSGLPSSSNEESLSEHYVALKRFLAPSLREERANPRSNRAKDKLLRLSPVQFHELSTDVFDELLRRQTTAGARRTGPGGFVQEGAPPFLLPEENFHPRRNQARQKLSTLPTQRFRDLASDVFYELERRFPRFAGAEIDRTNSVASSLRGGVKTPQMGPGGARGPTPSSGLQSRNLSISEAYVRTDQPNGTPHASMDVSAYGRQSPMGGRPISNAIVPNKSTLVDDDETVGPNQYPPQGNPYGLDKRRSTRQMSKVMNSSEVRRNLESTDSWLLKWLRTCAKFLLQISAHNEAESRAQIHALQDKIDELQAQLREREQEYSRLQSSSSARDRTVEVDRQGWSELQKNLEQKLSNAQSLNESLKAELQKLHSTNQDLERDLRNLPHQTSQGINGTEDGGPWKGEYERLERRYEKLKHDLQDQQQVTEEVKREASNSLAEMKTLSDRCGQSWEREEALLGRVARLEQEVKQWKNHYARARTQVRTLRASTIGPAIRPADVAGYANHHRFVSSDGRIKDVHVTKFQIAIDELLRAARVEEPSSVLEHMKAVVVSTRHLTHDVSDTNNDASKLKGRVNSHANELITVSKTFASSEGISPVALLDAAASHLTAAVVELIQVVKIRPTSQGEVVDGEPEEEVYMNGSTSRLSLVENETVSRGSVYSTATMSHYQQHRTSTIKIPSSTRAGMNNNNNTTTTTTTPFGPGMLRVESADHGTSFDYDSREQEVAVDELKINLEDLTEDLVQAVQALVSGIRTNTGLGIIQDYISDIATIVSNVIELTTTAIDEARNPMLKTALRERGHPVLGKLADCRALLLDASNFDHHNNNNNTAGGGSGSTGVNGGVGNDQGMLRGMINKLPPLAFEIARETKELIQRIDQVDLRSDHSGSGVIVGGGGGGGSTTTMTGGERDHQFR